MRTRARRAGPLLMAAAALSTAVSCVAPLAAQEPDTLRLTLDDALARARASSPLYRRAANDLGLGRIERRATWANEVLPRLTLSLLNTDYNGRLTRQATDFFGNPIDNPDAEFAYFSGTQQGLRLDWTLQGASLFNALDRQEAAQRQREVAASAAFHQVATSVRRRFYDALEQEALLAVERELAAARRVELDLAERLFSLAANSRVDVLSAQLEVEEQSLRALQQERALEQALLALRTAIGDADLPPIAPTARRLPVFDPALLDAEALVGVALASSPAAASATAAIRAAEVGVSEARESWWPRVSAGFSIGRFVQDQETAALFDFGGFNDEMYSSFNVGLTFPFFNDFFGNRARMAQAEVALEDRRESLREARLGAEQEVRSALVALRNQFEALGIAERALALAQEALELAREEYKLTARTFEQLQQVIDQERQARRQVVTARYGFVDALVTLGDAVGAPVAAPATG